MLLKDLQVPNVWSKSKRQQTANSITSEEEGTSLPVAVVEAPAHQGAGEDWDCWILAEGAGLDCQSQVAGEGLD